MLASPGESRQMHIIFNLNGTPSGSESPDPRSKGTGCHEFDSRSAGDVSLD